jgi:anti-anti-sigma factor
MEITAEDKGAYLKLNLSGNVDSSTAQTFEARLLGALTGEGRSVLVDLSGVDFLSSAGLRVFLMGAKKVKGTALRLVICGANENVHKVFTMSGFDRILDIAPDPEAGASRMA